MSRCTSVPTQYRFTAEGSSSCPTRYSYTVWRHFVCKTCDSDSSSLQGALWCHSLSPNSSTGVIDHMRMGRQMLSFPTNLLTCCQLRGAMVTPGECGGVPERTPECGGCSHRYEMHPSARKVQHKGGYFKASDEPAYVISSVCFYFFSHPSSNIGLKY